MNYAALDDEPDTVLKRGEKQKLFDYLDFNYLHSELAWDGNKILYGLRNDVEPIDEIIAIGRKRYSVKLQLTDWETTPDELLSKLNNGVELPQNPLNALNVILSHCIKRQRNIIQSKSGYFKPPPIDNAVHLENGLELWSGTGARVTPTDGFGITIRFIKKHQTFIRGGMNLADFIIEISPRQFRLNNSLLNGRDVRRLSNLLKGFKVTPTYARYPRKLTIAKISNSDANTRLVDRNDTVRKYLEEQYREQGVHITRPRLNCIELTNTNLIPIELLKVMPNQPYYDNNNARLQADIIRKSCINPNNWMKEISNSRDDVAEGAGEFEEMLDASIGKKFEETNGIVLERNEIQETFNANDISTRIIALQGCDEDVIDFFKTQLRNIARECGLNIDCRVFQNVLFEDLNEFLSKHHHNIIIGKELEYGKIKLHEMGGYHTQCLKYFTLEKLYRNRRMVSNTIKNILYKMNIKAGGENWRIRVKGNWPNTVFKEPVIIVGADVTHFNDGSPSIAAVVCNSSQFEFTAGSSYNFKISVQYPPENKNSIEYIKDMKNIMRDLLSAFYQSTRQKPGKIIYYRDGVSMGQFETIILEELNAIQEACTCLEEGYQPKVSIVVCTKRHGQRFVTKSRKNPDIGTVVSKDLVAPNYFNFYLFSQNVFQGIVHE